jgi:hypothetical protein
MALLTGFDGKDLGADGDGLIVAPLEGLIVFGADGTDGFNGADGFT